MVSASSWRTMRVLLKILLLSALMANALEETKGTEGGALDLLQLFDNPMPETTVKSRTTTAERISQHGYAVETHRICTEDGYLLTMFRIPSDSGEPLVQGRVRRRRPMVFIQHGLLGSSDSWISNGPDNALPYMLADAGFDVWLGNARGNTYSRQHTEGAFNQTFWRFSWHEIGHRDLPAMLRYALAVGKQDSLHYVGHSQGTTAFLVLLTTRPEFNAHIKTAHLLAPVAFMRHMNDRLVRTLAPYLGVSTAYPSAFASREFLPFNQLFVQLGYAACGSHSLASSLCSAVAYLAEGMSERTNLTALKLVAETHPAGGSTDQILHYMQEHLSGRFCQFDFGRAQNRLLYGRASPPDYRLELIDSELHLWYSDNDDSAAVVDVLKLANRLRNRVLHHVADPAWAHGDYTLAMQVRKYINQPIVDIMSHHEASLGTELLHECQSN